MRWIAGVSLLALGACVSVEQNTAACEASGYEPGTEEFDWCMIKREQSQREDAAFTGAAVGEVFSNYGEKVSRQPQIAAPQQPVQCTSNRVGTYIHTTCY